MQHIGPAEVHVWWCRDPASPRRPRDLELFIERCCTAREADRVRRHPERGRSAAMLRLWTLKEAYVKA